MDFLPVWAQIIVGLSVLCGAVGVLWRQVLKPGAKLINDMEEIMPVAREAGLLFSTNLVALKTLNNIADQFSPNGGGSLYDSIESLRDGINQLREELYALAETVNGMKHAADHVATTLSDSQDRATRAKGAPGAAADAAAIKPRRRK